MNDGGIFKFKYEERIKKEKVSSEKLKDEGIDKVNFIKMVL